MPVERILMLFSLRTARTLIDVNKEKLSMAARVMMGRGELSWGTEAAVLAEYALS